MVGKYVLCKASFEGIYKKIFGFRFLSWKARKAFKEKKQPSGTKGRKYTCRFSQPVREQADWGQGQPPLSASLTSGGGGAALQPLLSV